MEYLAKLIPYHKHIRKFVDMLFFFNRSSRYRGPNIQFSLLDYSIIVVGSVSYKLYDSEGVASRLIGLKN